MGRRLSALMALALALLGMVHLKADVTTVPVAFGSSQATAISRAVRLPDLDNHLVNPFLAAEGSNAIVFLFTSVDCPISNRYAPVVHRLSDTFAPKGVAFWLVYPNPAETPSAIRKHLQAFDYPVHALRDPKHELVKLLKVTVTPEAAVYDRKGRQVYRGRIDDRYVQLGLERPAATEFDLQNAIVATLAGMPVRVATTPAVGCFIADFVE
jgi:hypothetical protein